MEGFGAVNTIRIREHGSRTWTSSFPITMVKLRSTRLFIGTRQQSIIHSFKTPRSQNPQPTPLSAHSLQLIHPLPFPSLNPPPHIPLPGKISNAALPAAAPLDSVFLPAGRPFRRGQGADAVFIRRARFEQLAGRGAPEQARGFEPAGKGTSGGVVERQARGDGRGGGFGALEREAVDDGVRAAAGCEGALVVLMGAFVVGGGGRGCDLVVGHRGVGFFDEERD